jgi:periplasmic protein CpxP/Spy
MKRQLFALAIAGLIGVGTMAAQDQDATPPQQHQRRPQQMDPGRQVKMLTKRLNLTDDQQKQLLPILTDQKQQFDNLRNDASIQPQDKREKMRSLREDTSTKIKGILTDSQKQTYDQMQQQMRERMQQHRSAANNN